jgi:membrane-associated protease RseP (regulator of RpoE activity)
MTDTQRHHEAPASGAPVPDGPREQVVYETGGLRLALLIAAGIAAGLIWGWWLMVMVLGIGLMIFLHELGHFLTAKWSGMKVTEFFIGFGPRLWSFHRGETEYGVKVLPVGAYVRIIGMNNLDEVDPADEPRTYRQQSFPKRLLVVSAGSLAHFAQAFVLLVVLLGVVGVPGGSITRGPEGNPQGWDVDTVTRGSAAREAGLRHGDRIVGFAGEPVSEFPDIAGAVRKHEVGDTIRLDVDRDGTERTFYATLGPRPAGLEGGRAGSPFLGVSTRGYYPREAVGVGTAVLRVPGETVRFVGDSVGALAGVFSLHGIGDMADNVTNARSDRAAQSSGSTTTVDEDRQQNRLLSILGVARLGAQIGEQDGPALLLLLFFEMNIFIGLFNMLPLPPLDGGHAAVAIYERSRSRRGLRYHADATKLLPITYAVFMGLVILGVATIYLDLVNPINL